MPWWQWLILFITTAPGWVALAWNIYIWYTRRKSEAPRLIVDTPRSQRIETSEPDVLCLGYRARITNRSTQANSVTQAWLFVDMDGERSAVAPMDLKEIETTGIPGNLVERFGPSAPLPVYLEPGKSIEFRSIFKIQLPPDRKIEHLSTQISIWDGFDKYYLGHWSPWIMTIPD